MPFRWPHYDLVIRLGVGLLIGLGLTYTPMHGWEGKLYNLRFLIRGQSDPLPSIYLIGYDETSIKELGHGFPPTASEHADLILKLAEKHPKGVGFLYDFGVVFDRKETDKLALELTPLKTPIISSDWKGYIVRPQPGALQDYFGPVVPAGLTEDASSYAKDRVSRRLITHFNGIPQFEYQMAQFLLPNLKPRGEYVNANFPEMNLREILVNYDGPAGTYPIHSMSRILRFNDLPPLDDKIVLIGRADFNDPEESRFNPFETDQLNLTKLEADAQAISSLVKENGIIRPPFWVHAGLTTGFTVLASFITMGSSPALGVLFLLVTIFGVLAVSQVLFSIFGIAIVTIHPILGILITYYVYVPYRLIVEYRKRFYYQKKHSLLKQVEELKTNFISLMSHDIKTPIAKIHGLAQSCLQDHAEGRNHQMEENLNHILMSSDDLTRFVNSILDLSKIESGAVKLLKSTKDLNALVRDCVEQFRFVAEKRGISMNVELEPMFSVSMDPNLIRQVIQNLLDNSLKYCRENSQVTIRTQDKGNHVEFTISDESEGIVPEDLEHLFEKFYRPKSTIDKKHSGTGLGLYLVRYFVELHKGFVSATSLPGKGSTFGFSLPIEGKS